MYRVDLNCDMGESFGVYKIGNDQELLEYVTSVNIACGFHAGDPSTMHRTVQYALEKGARIGAHPGLPDLLGFGRRNIAITIEEAYDLVLYQVGALSAFVKAAGGRLQHVKPHGALYNMAAKDYRLAEAIARAVYDIDPSLILFGLAGSKLIRAGEDIGLKVVQEAFADRTYQHDGSLTPRHDPHSLIDNEEEAIHQVIRMVKEGVVRTQQGIDIPLKADTICIHGDGAHALTFARNIQRSLTEAGIIIQPFI